MLNILIGPEDIFGGNLKLILGLIWTLIRQYQIRSSGKDVSTKAALLAWANTQIPEYNIKNFTTDWNSGMALCALIEHIKPGSCPQYSTLSAQNGLTNCELGLRLAEEQFGIPSILEAAVLSSPDVDELSVMTYISYFCKPVAEKLMIWLKGLLPDRNVTNLTTDWNSGIFLAYLVDTMSPGSFPNWGQLNAADAVQNITTAIDVAEKQLQVKAFIKASQMADSTVDELNQSILLLRLQAIYKPILKKLQCSGPGLTKAVVGRTTNFQVDGAKLSGEPKISAVITGQKGSLPVSIVKQQNGVFQATYTPNAAGKLSIDIRWEGAVEQHYNVEVSDPGSFVITSKYFMPGQFAKIGQPIIMEAKGLQDIAELSVTIQHQNGKTEVGKVVSKGAGTAEVTYTPTQPGTDQIIVQVMGAPVSGSPFKVVVVDPSQFSVSTMAKFLIIMKETTITITGNPQGLKASAKYQNREKELSIVPQSNGTSIIKYTPTEAGEHTIFITYDGEHIKGSPLSFPVCDPTKCILMDSVSKHFQLGTSTLIKVSTKGAGPGQLECTSSNTSVATATVSKGDQDYYGLKITPITIGEATVRLTWAEEIVPPSPFTVYVCDASQCSAYGRGLTSGVGKTGEQFEFTVKATRAGPGELVVKVQGPKAVYTAKVTKTGEDIYEASFVTSEVGQHIIDVRWAGFPIPNSPYKVNVIEGANSSQFTFTSDKLSSCIVLQPVKCVLVGPVGDLLKNGLLQVKLRGQGFESKLVGPSEFKPVSTEAQISIVESKKGSYEIQYYTPKPGQFSLSIIIDGTDIPGSPFQIKSLPSSDASNCVVNLEGLLYIILGKSFEFGVDFTKAGTGALTARAVNCSCKVFITQQEGKKYTIRLEPKEAGIQTIEVLWDEIPIPGSPFVFTVVDPSSIVISDLPGKDYVARVGVPFTFGLNLGSMDTAFLKAWVKLSTGMIDAFTVSGKHPDGVVKLSYTPKGAGEMELYLTYAQVNLLKSVFKYTILNLSTFQVARPAGYCRLKDSVKFTINGLKQGDPKLSITAAHSELDVPIKVTFDSTVAQFAPKQLGEYVVSVMYANLHISGSPFSVFVSDPDACIITSFPPTVVHVREMASIIVDTSKAGPGELACNPASSPKDLAVPVKIVKNKQDSILFNSDTIGTSDMVVTWAGYPFASSSLPVSFVDASKAKWTCGHSLDCGVVTLGESFSFTIDCSQSGQGKPEVKVLSPSGHFGVQVDDDRKKGNYTAILKPMELGKHEVAITLAGKPVGNEFKFEVIKNTSHSITVLSEGLDSIVAGKLSKITVHASESGLLKRGLLEIELSSSTIPKGDPRLPKLTIQDNSDGTYVLQILAAEVGQYLLHVYWLKKPVSGSPFTLSVKPNSDASKCILSGKFTDMTTVPVSVPVEFTVDTTDAGHGQLVVAATDPQRRALRVSVVEDRGKRTLHHVKFVPQSPGSYTVNVTWDGASIPNSPLKFSAINPSKCTVSQFPKGALPLGQSLRFTVDTHLAGDAAPVVMVSDTSNQKPEVLKATTDATTRLCEYVYKAIRVGTVTFDITYNDSAISGSPFKVVVVDPSQCSVSIKDSPPGKPLVIHKEVTLSVAGSVHDLHVIVKSQGGEQELSVTTQSDSLRLSKYFPFEVGQHTAHVTCGGEHVRGSPLHFVVIDPAMCILNSVPRYLLVGTPVAITVTTKGAGPGQLECSSSNTSIAEASIFKNEQDLYSLKLTPGSIGETQISLLWGEAVPSTPFTVYVCDASQCSASGRGLTSDVGKTGEQFDFTVKTTQAGPGELAVKVQGPKAVYTAKVIRTSDDTYNVVFTTSDVGQHTIDVRWAGATIPKSPYKVDFTKRIDTSSFTVSGSGVGTCIALRPAKCSLVGSVGDLLKSGLLQVKLSGEGFESKTVGPSEFKPVATQALVSVVESKKGTYEIQYCTPKAGQFSLSITIDEVQIPGSPFQIQSLSSPDASQCSFYGSSIESQVSHVLGKNIEFKVDLSGAGIGTLTTKTINGSCKIFVNQEEDRLYSIRVEPKEGGLIKIEVLWDDVPVSGSPFSFTVVDTSSIVIIDLPNSKDYVAKVGEPFTLNLNLGSMDAALLKAEAQHSNGKVEQFVVSGKLSNGVVTLSYIPKEVGEFQLLLTYAQINLLKSIFKYSIVNSSALQVTVPSGYCRFKESVKLIINGVKQGDQKLSITAVHKAHDAAVKINYDNNSAVAQFAPKQLGEYVVSVMYASHHVSGSPFSIFITDPDACIVTSPPPSVVHIKDLATLIVDKTKAGPGEFGCSPSLPAVQSRIVKNKYDCCVFSCDVVGTSDMVVTWAGYPFALSSLLVNFVDASKAKWTCGHSLDCGVVMLGESVPFAIDCSQCGQGRPEVNTMGPSGRLMVQVDDDKKRGFYAAVVKPQELGKHDTAITLAGKQVGSLVEFEVIKNISLSATSLVGFTVIIAGKLAEAMLHVSESGLVKRGLLMIECTSSTIPKGDPRLPKLTIQDNSDGTYLLQILAPEPGQYLLHVYWLKKPISGSPFTLLVRPRPDASKCILSGKFTDVTTVLASVPVEFTVDTTDAGYGQLAVSATDPLRKTDRLIPVEELGKRTLYRLKFVPKIIGVHAVNLTWDGVSTPGSPLKFNAIDPSKCIVSQFPTGAIPLGRIVMFTVDTQLAGNGALVVMVTEGIEQPVTMKATNPLPTNIYDYRYKATKVGNVYFDILFNDNRLSGSPFKVVVVDPSQCTVSVKDPPLGKSLIVKKEAIFSITGNMHDVLIVMKSPTKEVELSLIPQKEGLGFFKYTPSEIGQHTVIVTCGGENVRGSPLNVVVVNPAMCILNSVPRYLLVGTPVAITVTTKGAGPGQLECSSSNTSIAEASISKNEQDSYSLKLTPVSIGETSVSVTWGQWTISSTPFTVYVCDVSQCSAYGRGLTSGIGMTGEPFDFTVKTTRAGPGEPVVEVQGPKTLYPAKVTKATDDTYSVSFVSSEIGQHMISVRWAGFPIPNSPYNVQFRKRIDAKAFSTSGNGVRTCIALRPADCMLVGPVGDLLKNGLLQMKLTGQGFEGRLVEPSDLKPTTKELLFSIMETKEGTYQIQYCTPTAGQFILSIIVDEMHIPGSPLLIQSLPAPDASLCRYFGSLFDSTTIYIIGMLFEFRVDVTKAGTGVLTAKAINCNCKIFITQHAEGVFIIKLEPQEAGLHKIEVLWDNLPIPGSPFSFTVVDPASIVVVDLPNSKDYAVRIGETFMFNVNLGSLDPSPLKAEVRLSSGKVVPLTLSSKLPNGIVSISYVPKDAEEFQLFLSYGTYNLLKSVVKYSIVNQQVLSFQVTIPTGYCRVKENVKFTVGGVKLADQKLTFTAVHKDHEVPVNVQYVFNSITAQFVPKKVGEYLVSIFCNARHISGSPFRFIACDPDACTITSKLLKVVHVGNEVTLAVDSSKAGPGELACKPVYTSNDLAVQIRKEPEGIVFSSDTIGVCDLALTWAGYSFTGSTIKVIFVDSSKVKWSCERSIHNSTVILGESISFTIDCSESGQEAPEVSAVGPSGPYVVQVIEDSKKGIFLAILKTAQLGKHIVMITLAGKSVCVPIEFEVINEVIKEVIKTEVSTVLNVVPALPKTVEVVTEEVTFAPNTEESTTLVSTSKKQTQVNTQITTSEITFASEEFDYSDETIRIAGFDYKTKCSLVRELAFFFIGGKISSLDSLTGVAHGPSSDLKMTIVRHERRFKASFTPPEAGSYEVFVDYAGSSIQGTPFTLKVVDPSKCQVLGDMPTVIQVSTTAEFVLKTRGAGPGDLSYLLDGRATSTIATCSIENQGQDTYNVLLSAKKVGVIELSLLWGGYIIPHFPIRVSVCDAKQCKIIGQVVATRSGNLGEPVKFAVTHPQAGEATLSVTVDGPTSQCDVEITETKPSTHEVTFIPWELGQHIVNVTWGAQAIPNSPLDINIKLAINSTRVMIAVGPGLKSAIAKKEAAFTIISGQLSTGLYGSGALKVSITGVQVSANVDVIDNNNGCYSVRYVPPVPGAYLVAILLNDKNIAGSPFNVNVLLGSDASKCRAYGSALAQNAVLFSGNPIDFSVDTKDGGNGKLRVEVQGPQEYEAAGFVTDEGSGQYLVKCNTVNPGWYLVSVFWSEQHIPGSPFKLKVFPAPNAAMVKAYGPGLQNGVLGDKGEIYVQGQYMY